MTTIQDEARARERIATLEHSAEAHDRAGHIIQAKAARQNADLIRTLWEVSV